MWRGGRGGPTVHGGGSNISPRGAGASSRGNASPRGEGMFSSQGTTPFPPYQRKRPFPDGGQGEFSTGGTSQERRSWQRHRSSDSEGVERPYRRSMSQEEERSRSSDQSSMKDDDDMRSQHREMDDPRSDSIEDDESAWNRGRLRHHGGSSPLAQRESHSMSPPQRGHDHSPPPPSHHSYRRNSPSPPHRLPPDTELEEGEALSSDDEPPYSQPEKRPRLHDSSGAYPDLPRTNLPSPPPIQRHFHGPPIDESLPPHRAAHHEEDDPDHALYGRRHSELGDEDRGGATSHPRIRSRRGDFPDEDIPGMEGDRAAMGHFSGEASRVTRAGKKRSEEENAPIARRLRDRMQ